MTSKYKDKWQKMGYNKNIMDKNALKREILQDAV